jgi:hypothetical protein
MKHSAFLKNAESLDAGRSQLDHDMTLALRLLPECAQKDALADVIVLIVILGQAWSLRCVCFL